MEMNDYIPTVALEVRDEQIIPFMIIDTDTIYIPYFVAWNIGCGTITIKE